MSLKLPSIAPGDVGALVTAVNQPITDVENAWIKSTAGSVFVCFSEELCKSFELKFLWNVLLETR